MIGAVRFETSCAPEGQAAFDRAVATLHSFEFGEARDLFETIASQDSDRAMAAWGVAMTHYHPLWAPPTPQELALGAAAVARARSYDSTERERLYIEAIGALFDGPDEAPHPERAVRYEEAMARVYEQSPDDTEAEIFYALAILSNADPTDKTDAVQKRTGAMLEPLFVEMPDHPGLAHYIIHSYDYPDLADRAVHAADRYLEIATSMPHALHMSGHIYTQLGMWDESIGANVRSAASAVERAEMFGLGEGTQGEMHALDYLVYAHLQRGEDAAAEAIVDHVTWTMASSFSMLAPSRCGMQEQHQPRAGSARPRAIGRRAGRTEPTPGGPRRIRGIDDPRAAPLQHLCRGGPGRGGGRRD